MSIALHSVLDGREDAPPVLLGGALGTTTALFDDLAETLSATRLVVRFDHRGHGASPAPPGPYSMSDLAADVVELAEARGIDRFVYVGLSLGGAVGLTLAVEHPARLTSLVLACTGSSLGGPGAWEERTRTALADGLAPLAEAARGRWFTPVYAREHPDVVEAVMDRFLDNPPAGYAACCQAAGSYDVTSRLGSIKTPTRVIAGGEDVGFPTDALRELAAAIPGADLTVVPGAAHLANLADPDTFGALVREHLDRTVPAAE